MSFERYKKDIEKLVHEGKLLELAIYLEFHPEEAKNHKLTKKYINSLPKPRTKYQSWYSEFLECVSQLLPDRKEDFVSY